MPLPIDLEWFREAELPALDALRSVCVEARAMLEEEACLAFPGVDAGPTVERVWDDLMRALRGDVDPLRWRLSALGVHAAYSGVELRVINEATQLVRRRVVQGLIATYGARPAKLESVLNVMQQLVDRSLWTITREYLLHREAMMEDQRRNELKERQRAEKMRLRSVELEAENRRIREVSRTKSEFLANMSHELRTPLNSIIGFADLLHDGEIPQDQERELLADILRSARHLLTMINDVLDLAKVEAGKLEFCPEEVALAPLVQEVTEALRPAASKGRVVLSIDVPAELEPVWVDPARMRQVLYNYLSNAIKFTPVDGQVVVRGWIDQDLWLEVQDDGVGIPAQDLSRLFTDFEQLTPGTHGGTGLGLALTRRIVEAQGGRVGVRSQPGRGSTFWARLPCERLARASSYFEQLRPSGVHARTDLPLEPGDASAKPLQRSGT
ncbi:MAG: ATP-binding protein [Polyangiales bacterium]